MRPAGVPVSVRDTFVVCGLFVCSSMLQACEDRSFAFFVAGYCVVVVAFGVSTKVVPPYREKKEHGNR